MEATIQSTVETAAAASFIASITAVEQSMLLEEAVVIKHIRGLGALRQGCAEYQTALAKTGSVVCLDHPDIC